MKKHSILWFLLLSFLAAQAGDFTKVMDLRGTWKFSIGDRESWAAPAFDDRDWESIEVPGPWEDQGFHGYNGYAWYRRAFRLQENSKADNYYLILGYIDDADEVYLNGVLIGFSGAFPPHTRTAYQALRVYPIPRDLLRRNEPNTLAVRVYDSHLSGGIVSGEVGIYQRKERLPLAVNLAGPWEFRLGDRLPWGGDEAISADWDRMMVPGFWENGGYRDYDGYAWYRKSICLSPALTQQDLVLLLGKIDDVDQTFINGKLLAATGLREDGPIKERDSESYQKFRAYLIPAYTLQPNQNQTLFVRVYDWMRDGGIYQGPIGLIPYSIYRKIR
jgi:hypothetical protein